MSVLFSIILPVFGVIGIGMLARRYGGFSDQSLTDFSRFVYYIAVPPLLFLAMARTPWEALAQWQFMAAYLGATVLLWSLLFMSLRVMTDAFDPRWLLGLGATFSNSVYLGIPLVQSAFGPAGTQWVVLIALATNVLFVAGTAIVLSARRQAGTLVVLLESVKNPMVMAIALGLVWSGFGLSLAQPIDRLLSLLAQAASPVALFALGLTLGRARVSMGAQMRLSGLLVVTKLLIHPALVALGCWWLGVPALQAQVAIVVAALPAGALAHLLAQRFGHQDVTIANAVLWGTLASMLTLSVLLSLSVFTQLQ